VGAQAVATVMEITGCTRARAETALLFDGRPRTAIDMILQGTT
jgi:hypothetical protein